MYHRDYWALPVNKLFSRILRVGKQKGPLVWCFGGTRLQRNSVRATFSAPITRADRAMDPGTDVPGKAHSKASFPMAISFPKFRNHGDHSFFPFDSLPSL